MESILAEVQEEPTPWLPEHEFHRRVIEAGVASQADVEAHSFSETNWTSPSRGIAATLVDRGVLTQYQALRLFEDDGADLVLGNYRVLDRIGSGGMGEVFKALHSRMDRVVAIKTLLPDRVSTASLSRFEREAQAVAKLSHPNIVAAYDAGQHRSKHFLVMEYAEGTDLLKAVRNSGPMMLPRAVDCVLQAAAGLEFAHSKGIVHRDVKPGNLMIDRQGAVRVLDLGLAHIATQNGNATDTGDAMGTVDFMSPEQAVDAKRADARSDVYSLGCTFYYLMHGRAPYHADSPANTLLAHREDNIPRLSEGRDDVPDHFNGILARMLAKNPDDRFATMKQVSDALRKHLAPAPEFERSKGQDLQEILTPANNPNPTAQFATTISPGGDGNTPRQSRLGKRERPSVARPYYRSSLFRRISGALVMIAGLIVLGIIVFRVKTPTGTVVVKLNQPEAAGAIVTIDGRQKLTIKGGVLDTSFEITVDGEEHVLRITHPDFVTYAKRFVAKSDGKQVFEVALEPILPSTPRSPSVPVAPFSPDLARAHQQTWAVRLGVPVEFTNSVGMRFRLVPPMRLGSQTTGAVYVSVYEVTQSEFRQVLQRNVSMFRKGAARAERVKRTDTSRHPVDEASAKDAVDFCTALSKLKQEKVKQRVYRLLTGPEWEHACLAGFKSGFGFDERQESLEKFAWHRPNGGGVTHRVGQLKANAFGLHDMHGNVFEWTSTRSAQSYMIYGGAWTSGRAMCMTKPTPFEKRKAGLRGNVGFRIVCEPKNVARELLRRPNLLDRSVVGKWSINKGVLVSPNDRYARLELGYRPPREYDLTVVVERVNGTDCLVLGNVSSGQQFAIALDLGGDVAGLTHVDKKRLSRNGTAVRKKLLRRGSRHTITCAIRKHGVSVTCDGKKIVDWRGKPSRLSLSRLWTVPDAKGLFVGSHGSTFRVSRMTLIPR